MKSKTFLLLIPLLTLLLNAAIVIERNPFYSSWVDPTYDYLFNGLNIAAGHLQVGHAPHPGTSLHLYTGILLKFFHLFRSETDIIKDVLLNPEWYLFRICLTSCLLISLSMFAAGWLVLRFTGNMFYALLIQCTHLISLRSLFFSQNLMTEFILVLTGLLLAPLIVIYALSENRKRDNEFIVAAAILSGIMMAGKLSSAPLVFLWLIMSKNVRHFFYYAGITALSFILFTFPAWGIASEFFGWIGNMATHTGHYGQGDEGFANWNKFFGNILLVANDVWLFTGTFLLLTVIIIRLLLNIFRKKKESFFSKAGKPLIGIWVALVVQTFIVCKQYSAHYIIPSHLLVIPAWIILSETFFRNVWGRVRDNGRLFFIIVPIVFGCLLLTKAVQFYNFWPGLKQPDKMLLEKVKPYKYDLLLLDCNITAPFPQAALYYGVNYAGLTMGLRYFELLEKQYTGFYIVNHKTGKVRQWRNEYLLKDVLKDSMQVLYYSSNDKFSIDSLQWEDSGFGADSVLFSYTHSGTKESVSVVKIKRLNN